MAEGTDRGTDSQASLNVAQRILAVDAKYNSMRLTSYPRQSTSSAPIAFLNERICIDSIFVFKDTLN